MKPVSFIHACAAVMLLGLAPQVLGEVPEAIYHNGPIYTMIRDGDRVEAIAVDKGKISAAGSAEEILAIKGADTQMLDLQGRTLLPGFIDPHSHVIQQALKFSVVNLDPHPIGDVKSITDIQRKLRERIDEKKLEPGKWVFGWGYDDTGVEEQRHPTRKDLDAVSPEHPIVLMHISSHLMTSNSKALEIAGVTAETADSEGGKIQRQDGSREPNGMMEAKAITKDAAWQYFEEHRKGTLEQGKLADLVVLAEDPFTINPVKIGGIKILETIKEGKTVLAQE